MSAAPARRRVAGFSSRAVVFPLACLAALVMVLVSELSHWQSTRARGQLAELAQLRDTIRDLERVTVAAESAQRGYLLTFRPEQFDHFEAERGRVDAAVRALDAQARGASPAVQQLARRLRDQVDARMSALGASIELDDRARAVGRPGVMLGDVGPAPMEAVAALGRELLAQGTADAAWTETDLRHTAALRRIGIAGLSLLCLLALYLYLRQKDLLTERRQQLVRAAQGDHDRLEIEVAERTAELTELAKHLQTAREDERARLARDLHDELGALLTSAKLDAARIKSRLAGAAPGALERLAHLVATLDDVIELKRRIVEDLRPSSLDTLGLVETLGILAREFAGRSGVEVVTDLQAVTLAPPAELVVYRVVQEAINNISKYAGARHVRIDLGQVGDRVTVAVRDDGVGFDPAGLSSAAHGLLGMRFRVEAERGSMALASAPGCGTSIEVMLPAA